MMKLRSLLLTTVFLVGGSGAVWAQQVPQEEPLARPRTAIGLQLTWPTYGVSGMMDVGDNLSIQGVVGPFRGLSITGRGLFRLSPQELFTPFVFGALGYSTGDVLVGVTRAGPHFGGGGGVEMDLRRLVPDLPPLFLNLEAGVLITSWTDGLGRGRTSTHFTLGPGIFYRF